VENVKGSEKKKTEVVAKRGGIGSICPIYANKNQADLYPE